ncbi:fluoride efflux transporter CrcB [Clostridium thailandense]|uniref:fluoride efflux transporter CrcB n=1 Tax=Clostridium thailandense TaxID=2794346 RepID=UPI003988B88C
MNFLLVGMGGILGSITRYSLGKFISERSKSSFPIGTAFINITGALFLGMLSNPIIGKNTYLFLGDGFLGAYTTFSTFMYEGFNLFQENAKLNAFTYILMSVILGLIGYILGVKLSYLL